LGRNFFVYLDDRELQSSAFQGLLQKEQKKNNNDMVYPDNGYPAVDLRKVNEDNLGANRGEGQSNRIGFAEQGFQTFQLDIPNEFRGKVVTLKFELGGGTTVYLDNVFFKSQHLLFGNPNLTNQFKNEQEARKDLDTPVFDSGYDPFQDIQNTPPSDFFDNYLIEKPQYSLSYNDNLKTPNWVSYQLNKSWLGTYNQNPEFGPDPRLPFDLSANKNDIPDSTNYQRGHMTTRSHRSRNKQDYVATFLMSNIIPQPLNKPQDRWTTLENWLTDLVKVKNKEFYIIAGRDGQATNQFGVPLYLNKKVSVPENVWKVVLVLDKPGQGISDITEDTLVFAIRLPNTLTDYAGTDPKFIGKKVGQDPDNDWRQEIINVDELEYITEYDFLSNIPTDIQESIEEREIGDIKAKIIAMITEPASLMAATNNELSSIPILGSNYDDAIGHSGIPDQIPTSAESRIESTSVLEIGISQNSVLESIEFSPAKNSPRGIHMIQAGASEIGFRQNTPMQVDGVEISIPNDRSIQSSVSQKSTSQISTSQISLSQIGIFQIGSAQVDTSQINPFEVDWLEETKSLRLDQLNPSKISLPVTITNDQLFTSNFPDHNLTSNLISNLNYTELNLWNNYIDSTTLLEITYQITDLPIGQLAEAQITSFNEFGRPKTGTILIDYNANGVGWFIDRTPFENSEFGLENAEWALQATPESEAYGKYDLLTAILHETAHLYGFIDGYAPFEKHISWDNGTPLFIGDNFTATLTPDLDHLQTAHHPYDLLNTHLAPGIRKLPSLLDIQILQAIVSEAGSREKGAGRNILQAPLTSTPLIAILNGDFSIDDSSNPQFGWHTRGDSTIVAEQAILREDSPFLSNFSQTFTIPEGAKILQFTIANTQLGPNSQFIPDAFEAALLDAQTLNPLVAPALSLSDSFLNLQPQLLTYKSENVKVSGKINSPTNAQTVYVDISHLTPGTEAILFFDLLGFGEKDSYVNSILDFGFWILDFGFWIFPSLIGGLRILDFGFWINDFMI
jgi:DNA/RNA endonuclease G (NUC1)